MRPFIKISSKVHSAIMLLTFIESQRGEKHATSLSYISDYLKLSYGYLEQVAKQLKDAKLIKSYRGSAGGYRLNKKRISILDVIEAVEGPMALVDCLGGEKCQSSGRCPSKSIWLELQNELSKSLNKIKVV